jgi:hypothetical protein
VTDSRFSGLLKSTLESFGHITLDSWQLPRPARGLEVP